MIFRVVILLPLITSLVVETDLKLCDPAVSPPKEKVVCSLGPNELNDINDRTKSGNMLRPFPLPLVLCLFSPWLSNELSQKSCAKGSSPPKNSLKISSGLRNM
uniref:Secreted protein n=1 Tax=Dromaius novaehollandiae TaxID=8790 RepID=A0A8C4J5J6_DRONO